jgi:hypothetical protein
LEGSKPCKTCSRTISANKTFCAECWRRIQNRMAELMAEEQTKQLEVAA